MIVGFVGMARSGKDTAAQIIIETEQQLKGGESVYRRDSFAAPMKRLSISLFGKDSELPENKEKEVPVDDEDLNLIIYEIAIMLAGSKGELEQGYEYGCMEWERLYAFAYAHAEEVLTKGRHGGKLSPRRFQQLVGTEIVRHLNPNYWVDRLVSDAAKYPEKITLVTDVRYQNELDVCDSVIHVKRDMDTRVHSHTSEQLATLAQESGIANLLKKPVPFYTVVNNGTLDDFRRQFEALALYNLSNLLVIPEGERQ